MHRYFGLDDSGNRIETATVALVVGKILEVKPGPSSSKLLVQSDSGEKSEIELHTKIFGDNFIEMRGARVMCAVHNTQWFDSAPSYRDVYEDHEVLCILDGAKAGTLLEYKNRRQP